MVDWPKFAVAASIHELHWALKQRAEEVIVSDKFVKRTPPDHNHLLLGYIIAVSVLPTTRSMIQQGPLR